MSALDIQDTSDCSILKALITPSSGDSGAAILNRRGALVGILVGGDRSDKPVVHDAFVFISVDDLFADIKEKTGATEVEVLSTY